jgi:nuclear GTP-binding protein
MPKIRKKSSKRLGLREKYSCLKKVANHHRKMRKTARKLSAAGIQPKPARTKMVIPNSFPGKEKLINEMEAQAKMEKAEALQKVNNLKQATIDFKNDHNIQF